MTIVEKHDPKICYRNIVTILKNILDLFMSLISKYYSLHQMNDNRINVVWWYPYFPTVFFATVPYLSFGLHDHLNSECFDSVNMLFKHCLLNTLPKFFLGKYTYVPYRKNVKKSNPSENFYCNHILPNFICIYFQDFQNVHL